MLWLLYSIYFVVQCTGKRLPEWAFQQYEVVTEREAGSTTAVWSLDDLVLPTASNATAWAEEEKSEHTATLWWNILHLPLYFYLLPHSATSLISLPLSQISHFSTTLCHLSISLSLSFFSFSHVVIREKVQSKGSGEDESEEEDDDSDGLNFWEKYIEIQVNFRYQCECLQVKN